MLVLTRRSGESIIIAGDIKITVVNVGPGRVKLGIEAPPHIRVDRQEIHDKIEQSSDVLAAVGSGEPAMSDAQNTMVNAGPDTALIVTSSASAPASNSTLKAAASLSPLSKYRLPRKPR